jgi:NADPH2:quinone reductase|tara:strand:+ start:480 stop:1475 length:996 start_codon:yes stop_codon:yes gene_type:complete
MKAIYYTETGPADKVLKFGDFNIPKINNKNDIILKMNYSSVNPADTKKRSGWLGSSLDKEFIIPHSDGIGTVVEVGNSNNNNMIGKNFWVCGGSKDIQFGTCAEYFLTISNNIFELSGNTSLLIASCLGVPVATAYYSVFSDNNPLNQTFFISGGAGAVSQYAIQFAKLSGAKVITTVSTKEKKEICENIGADLILNYKELTQKEIFKQVKDFTNSNFVDRCVEVDFNYNVNLIPQILKANGTLATYSCSSNPYPIFPYYQYAPKGINIKIVQAYLQEQSILKKCGNFVNDLLINNRLIHPKITTYNIEDTFKAHESQENSQLIGKNSIKI